MADHPNDLSILGLGSNQNRSVLHVSGKRSNLHLAFQNEKKPPPPPPEQPPPVEVVITKTVPPTKASTSATPPSVQSPQRSCSTTLQSPTSDPPDYSPPPPPLPPKLKLKHVNMDSFHQLTMGSGYAKPRIPNVTSKENLASGTNSFILEKPKLNKEGLSLNFGGIGASTEASSSRKSLFNSSSLTREENPTQSEDADSAFMEELSTRELKKKQLILHLPPSGASHHSHHHPPNSPNHHHSHQSHHRHLHHESRNHRRDRLSRGFYHNIQLSGKLNISPDLQVDFTADDLHDLGEIGRGGFGTVNKMVHRKTNTIMAVKRIRLTVDENEQKQLRDLEVAMWSNECPFIVQFYGATLKEGDCWICMELMDTSLDKFYKFVYEKLEDSIPETILGKVTLATLTALNYLKEKLKLIHRDVKPSNILLDRRGNIKLCDFGISGHLVDSIAKTRDAGCRPYMAPERIDPAQARGYDVRSDVWSLGITLMELATGAFPYPKWNSVFEQLTQVVQGEPPRLSHTTQNGNTFSHEFVGFVNTCLTKEESARPKYKHLLEHPFVLRSREQGTNVALYVTTILDHMDNDGKLMYTYNEYNY